MATTINPNDLFMGTPISITYGGTECGATVDPPNIKVVPTLYAPDFQNAVGPVTGAVFVTGVECTCELTVNELTAIKIAWALPGAEAVGDVISWTPGRVDSTAFKDLVLQQEGLDGALLTFTLLNALPEGGLTIPFSKSEVSGMKLTFKGYVDTATPNEAPFTIELTAGSGS
jgi:hypothetical protein